MREAKQHTTWVAPDEAPRGGGPVASPAPCSPTASSCATSCPSSASVAEAGDRAALGQLLLKLTVPGIPDIYQGDELLCLSLVDPDNRRPVDWDERRAALADPPPKLDLILRALALRARRPEAFAGSYEPLRGRPGRRRVRARRRRASRARCCAASRSTLKLPAGEWRDVLGERDASPARSRSTASRCSTRP